MFGLPLELITMLFSTVLGGVMSMVGYAILYRARWGYVYGRAEC